MNTAVDLLNQLDRLIATHGIDAVKYTLDFIDKYPLQSSKVYKSVHGVTLTEKEYSELNKLEGFTYADGSSKKIQRIKLLRNMRDLSLREAKEVIEDLFL